MTHVEVQSSSVILNPNVEEIQQLMHRLVNYVLNTFHGVRKWGEVRDLDAQSIHEHPMNDFSELLPTENYDETNGNNELSIQRTHGT